MTGSIFIYQFILSQSGTILADTNVLLIQYAERKKKKRESLCKNEMDAF